jgi:hypothetical protein
MLAVALLQRLLLMMVYRATTKDRLKERRGECENQIFLLMMVYK